MSSAAVHQNVCVCARVGVGEKAGMSDRVEKPSGRENVTA